MLTIDTYINTKKPYNVKMKPTNYRVFSPMTTDYFIKMGENSLPALSNNLKNNKNVVETLYILDRIVENKTADVSKLYPELSKYNSTNNPEIQTFLAGIYRKIQVPDAFGPLIAMLIRNSLNPAKTYFDPNEEIGGAILEYLR